MKGKYENLNIPVPFDKRADINYKLSLLIASKKTEENGVSQNDIFIYFTGKGALHGLDFSDYNSFYEFTEAKKNYEEGQFFTPHDICENIIKIINPKQKDLIADLTCGSGNFCNYVPEESNFFGVEIDKTAAEVAKYLYPEAKSDIFNCQHPL